MIIRTLWLRRKGWEVPELLAAVDEYTDDDNPDWFINECKKQKDLIGDDAESYTQLQIHVPQDMIERALNPRPIEAIAVTRE